MLPYEPLRSAAARWGLTSLPVDVDFSIRRHFAGFFGNPLPSLAWTVGSSLGLASARPEPPEPRWLRYYGPPLAIPHLSYSAALRPEEVPDSFFRDRIVVIGARPVVSGFGERRDEFVSPFSTRGRDELYMPGAEIHATQLLNLVRGDWLRRWSPAAEAGVLVLGALLLPAVLLRLRPATGAAVAVGAELAVLGAVAWAFRGANVWFPWLIFAVIQIPAAYLGAAVFHSLEWYRQRRRLEAARRVAEEKIREQAALIEKAQDAILVHDLSGRVLF